MSIYSDTFSNTTVCHKKWRVHQNCMNCDLFMTTDIFILRNMMELSRPVRLQSIMGNAQLVILVHHLQ